MSIGELPPVDLNNILDRLNTINNDIAAIYDYIFSLFNQIGNLNNRVNNLTTQVNNLTGRMNTAETNINNLYTYVNNLSSGLRGLDESVSNLWDQLSNYLRKATPIPGYNPYSVGGSLTANVWMYEITPIDDNNIKIYYIQFNNINGANRTQTNPIPFPRGRQFSRGFIYSLQNYPLGQARITSAKNIDYGVYIANPGFDKFLLTVEDNHGISVSNDMIGVLMIGNTN